MTREGRASSGKELSTWKLSRRPASRPREEEHARSKVLSPASIERPRKPPEEDDEEASAAAAGGGGGAKGAPARGGELSCRSLDTDALDDL